MPILNVKVIGELPDSIRKGLARRLAGPQQTWVTVQVVRQEDLPRTQMARRRKLSQ